MRNSRNRGIWMGLGLLGLGGLIGFSQPVTAAPRGKVKQESKQVKAARKNVKEERKELRRADSPRERREERQDLAAAQRKLRREQQDLRSARLRQARQQRQQNVRSRNTNYRPRYQSRSNYQTRNYQNRDFRTIEGRIVDDRRGDSFVLRRDNGDRVRVYLNNEPDRLDPGDRVRVYGYFDNGVFRARDFDVLRNR